MCWCLMFVSSFKFQVSIKCVKVRVGGGVLSLRVLVSSQKAFVPTFLLFFLHAGTPSLRLFSYSSTRSAKSSQPAYSFAKEWLAVVVRDGAMVKEGRE